MEWDIAAAHAILLASGGKMIEMKNGNDIFYAKPGFFNARFIAIGRGNKNEQ